MKIISIAVAVLALAAAARAQDDAAWNELADMAAMHGQGASIKAAAEAQVAAAKAAKPIVTSTQQLLDMRREDLERLYNLLAPGPIPNGKSDGIASVAPGTALGRASQAVMSALWQGKIFDGPGGRLINRLSTGEAVQAKVYDGDSWLDGQPSIIIDYKDTSTIAGFIRDEIREAAPGIYFGFAYMRHHDGTPGSAPIVFALDFNSPKK